MIRRDPSLPLQRKIARVGASSRIPRGKLEPTDTSLLVGRSVGDAFSGLSEEGETLVGRGAPLQEPRPGLRGFEAEHGPQGASAREPPARPGGGGHATGVGRVWPYLPSSRRAGIIDASSRPCSPMLRMRGARPRRRGGIPASTQRPLGGRRGARRCLARPKLPPGSCARPVRQALLLFRAGLWEVGRPRGGGVNRRGSGLVKFILAGSEPGMPGGRGPRRILGFSGLVLLLSVWEGQQSCLAPIPTHNRRRKGAWRAPGQTSSYGKCEN